MGLPRAIIAGVLLLAVAAQPAVAAIAVVAHTVKAGAAGGVTTDAVDTTGANLLVAVLSCYVQSTTAPTGIVDSKGNTWTPLTARQTATGDRYCRIYYCAGPTSVGSGHTIGVTGTNIYASLSLLAFSGAAASPYDQESGSFSAVSGTSIQPGSLTPAANGCVVVAGACTQGSSHSINSSFTHLGVNSGAGNMGMAAGYLVQTTATAVNPTISWTTSGSRSAAMATFKAATPTAPLIRYLRLLNAN